MSSVVNCARLVTKTIHVGASLGPYGDLVIRRVIGGYELKRFDPFLLLEDDVSSDGKAEFPDHPHRGVEIVNYVLEGAWKYEDFGGHKGTLEAGDLQWMTAGRGIVHSEVGDQSRGKSPPGTAPGVGSSLPNKMIELRMSRIEEVRDSQNQIIAGGFFGAKSPTHVRPLPCILILPLIQALIFSNQYHQNGMLFVCVEGKLSSGNLKSSPAKM
ncbi:hypothetical protein Leryth_005083 [Lithospermum erythrorhizon]|nr:hypothetical protein Leryth_005083 [Lithospermum erythrorhizon]